MSIFKCKMCGGTIEFEQGATVGVCDSCGTKQTLPRLDDDRRANLYDRANHFRRNNEFDKAAAIYEQILTEDTTDAEAYWSLVLCQYGIEYVEDPATRKRVPTVNRAQFTSIFDDDNYKSALQHADVYQRTLYEDEAAAINEIQKGILAISQKEEPFDVFICYKETDNNGRRTPDSVLANDLYHQLVQEGFKVFFARITLEDKLGTAYEPYIFAALNSAKVMVVLGTKPEHFNAVWVKNEWSRYLALVKKSGGKKILIPAYKDMDPYDLPDEFSHLQAQDMSKLGFMQDLIRGIKKIVTTDEPKAVVKETVVVDAAANANVAPLLKRAFMFLEDSDWKEADAYCEKVLDQDPENAQAYLGKLMAELKVRKQEELKDCKQPFDDRSNFQKAVRFGDEALSAALNGYIVHINERNETARLTGIYKRAVKTMKTANSERAYKSAAKDFQSIPGFKDADALAEQCLEKAEICRKEAIKKAEAAKRRIETIVNALKKGETQNNEPTLAEQLTSAKERIGYLERISSVFGSTQAQIQTLQSEMDGVIAQENKLVERQSQLGLFAGKEKKQIKEALAALLPKKQELAKQISQQQNAIGHYLNVSDIDRDLNEARNSAADLEAQIERARASASIEYTYEEALNIYLNDPDIAIKVNQIYPMASLIPFKQGKTNTILFGSYIQKKNGSPEPIEWLALAKDSEKVLVISKYALDCQPYNTSKTAVTWETCSLRRWLNGTFINTAFSADEKNRIIRTGVLAYKNPEYNTSPGNSTTDKVFLLSITEVNKYFNSNYARKCIPTDYAKAQGAVTDTNYGINCWWWLRSPGYYSFTAASVEYDGSIYIRGAPVEDVEISVRPAMWISLKP